MGQIVEQKSSGRHQRGGTLVELAIILPVLVALLFAILELSRAFNLQQTVTNAAREGARFAVSPCQSADAASSCSFTSGSYSVTFPPGTPPPASAIRAFVQDYLKADHVNVQDSRVQIVLDVDQKSGSQEWQTLSGSVGGTPFTVEYHYRTVEVRVPYHFFFFPFPDLTLHSEAVMKDEIDMVR